LDHGKAIAASIAALLELQNNLLRRHQNGDAALNGGDRYRLSL